MSISTEGEPSTAANRAARAFYRFYSIDVGNRIALAEDHEVDGDRPALALGKKILLASSHPKLEVWFGNLRVGVLAKDSLS
jgi:hypothetical protein